MFSRHEMIRNSEIYTVIVLINGTIKYLCRLFCIRNYIVYVKIIISQCSTVCLIESR